MNLNLTSKAELLRFFGARNLAVLERQFNGDGRRAPLMLDAEGRNLLLATAPGCDGARLRALSFPLHVSDLLGVIELDRLTAELEIVTA